MGDLLHFPARPGHEPQLTAKQVAEQLGMCLRWVRYRQNEGMPCHRYGRAVRFKMSEVEAWLERKAG